MAILILLSLSLSAIFITTTPATRISINNAGFESNDPNCPPNTYWYANKSVIGWTAYDPYAIMTDYEWCIGYTNPRNGDAMNDPIYGSGPPEGNAAVYIHVKHWNKGECGIQQTLSATLQPNTRYILTAKVGNPGKNCWSNSTDGPKCMIVRLGWPGYIMQLLAGDTIVAQDDNSIYVDDYHWALTTVQFTTTSSHPQLGNALTIRLLEKNDQNSSGFEVWFDDVILESNINSSLLTTASITDEDRDNLQSIWNNVFIVIGAVVICVSGAFCAFIYFRKQQNKANDIEDHLSMSEEQSRDAVGENNADLIRTWLSATVGLPQYYTTFIENGYNSLDSISNISTKEDLNEIGIKIKGHQTQLIAYIKQLNEAADDDKNEDIVIDNEMEKKDQSDSEDLFRDMGAVNPGAKTTTGSGPSPGQRTLKGVRQTRSGKAADKRKTGEDMMGTDLVASCDSDQNGNDEKQTHIQETEGVNRNTTNESQPYKEGNDRKHDVASETDSVEAAHITKSDKDNVKTTVNSAS